MAAKTLTQVALEDMRRAGFPNPYYPDSYARNEVRPLGRSNAAYSAQSDRAVLVMGRYADTRAFSASTNPDYAEIGWRSSAAVADLAGRTWNEILLWNHTYFTEEWGLANAAGWINNSRAGWWGFETWGRFASGWTRLAQDDSWSGHPISPTFRVEDFAGTYADVRVESGSGIRTVRLVQAAEPWGAGYWAYHGYAGGNKFFTAADLLDVCVVARISKFVHNAALADDREYMRLALAIGADYYPTPRIYDYPSVGCSRHKLLKARYPEWQFIVMHTMTESQLASIGLPPSIANLVENFDESGDPPPVLVPPKPAPRRGRWLDVYTGTRGRWVDIAPSPDVAPVWSGSIQLTATIGAAFSYTHPRLVAGTPAPTFTKQSGPSWASVNGSTGAITGTPTGSPTTTTIVVRASNSVDDVDVTLPLSVVAAPTAPTITTTSVAGGEEGVAYLQQLAATGTGPLTWSVTSGASALAALGLALSAAGGVISGAAPVAGSASITVRATGPTGLYDEQALTVTIGDAGDAPVITTLSLPDADLNEPYTATIEATGAEPLLFRVVAGAVPPGTTLDDESGEVSGTPTLAGGFPFTVEVSNGVVPVAVRQFSIRVVGAASASTPSPWTAVLKGR